MSAPMGDRMSIATLHVSAPPPPTRRDASQSTWNKPPTKISPPTNSGRGSTRIIPGNPYDRSRTVDNLHASRGSAKGGNPNSFNLNEHMRGQPPAKKQKLDISQTPKARKTVSRPQLDAAPKLKPEDSDLRYIDTQYLEDLGERVPPNLLNMGKTNGHASTSRSDHPSRSDSHRNTNGEHTKSLRNNVLLAPEDDQPVEIDDSDDPIESYPEEKKASQKGRVLETAAHYEKLQKHGTAQVVFPRVDLVETRAGVKSRMRPARNTQAAPLPFQKMKSETMNKVSKNIVFLPIKAWFLGRKLFQQPYYLVWLNNGKMSIKSGEAPGPPSRHSEDVDVKAIAQAVWFVRPEDPRPNKLVFLETLPGSKRPGQKALGVGYPEFFKQGGNRGEGDIAIKFDSDSPAWANHSYLLFVDWLKTNVEKREILSAVAGDSKWDMAVRTSQVIETKNQRESGVDVPENVPRERSRKRVYTSTSLPPDWADLPENTEDWSPPRSSAIANTVKPSQRPRRSGSPSMSIEILSPPRPFPRPAYFAAGTEEVHRSTRQSDAPPQSNVDMDEVILVYPPGQTGAVNITNGDVVRLNPNEFLNDTLIEFGLKLWLQELEKTNPELVQQIHVVSSFFYKKLSHKDIQQGYDSVKKWTSRFNLFEKKYIIVPINENLHWYLAIIYHPEHILKPPLPTKSPTTRRKTRQEADETPLVEPSGKPPDSKASSVTRHSPTPLEGPSGDRAPTPASLSNEADAEEVNEMMKSSCSITEDEVSPGDKQEMMEAEGTVDHDSLFGDVGPMDVDESTRGPEPIPATLIDEGDSQTASEEQTMPDPEIMDVDDPVDPDQSRDPLDLFAVDDPPEPFSRTVAPVNFYGKASGKRKAESPILDTFPPQGAPFYLERDGDDDEVHVVSEQPCTYIFTLDSLGARHPKVTKVLGQYLRMEAQDKRGVPSEQCSLPIGKTAQVPLQPNYCDCGIYLLHLAQTFISNADHYYKILLNPKKMSAEQRSVLWHAKHTTVIRETLRTRIEELSRDWKKAKQELKNKEVDVVPESSDDEIDIVETTPATATLPPQLQRKFKSSAVTSTGRAARLR